MATRIRVVASGQGNAVGWGTTILHDGPFSTIWFTMWLNQFN
jgi:hypothetical protein